MILCSLVLAVLGWTTSSHAAPQLEKNGFKAQKKQDRKEKYVLESAEVDWQVVATRKKGVDRCPQVAGWDTADTWLVQTLRPPNEQPDPYRDKQLEIKLRRAMATEPLLKELDRFCTYRKHSGSAPSFPSPPPAGLEKPAGSRMALVPAGDPVSILAQHFLDQTSGMPPNFSLPPGKPPVRLVFIDTEPDHEGVPHSSAPSKHGYSLVHQAQELACKTVYPCPSEFATRLALRYSNRDLPLPGANTNSQGGHLGLVEDLAAAITREVWTWRQSGSKQHLVLNLSVGWDELSVDRQGKKLHELDIKKVSKLKPDTQLVYYALQYARRSGALVIAAAGNRRGGEESKGPLLPAGWELRPPSCLPFALGPKPVYAVGGVDWQGLPLPNYRQGGLPQRVAFGDHAITTPTGSSDEPTAMYTGTSVSAAVVSSIAAVAWYLRPELPPAEVMNLISQSGDGLPVRADYYAWKNLWPLSHLVKAPHLRRLSLCRAVQQACAGGGGCAIPSCQPWEPNKAADLSVLVSGNPQISPLPALETTTLPTACGSASDPAPKFFAIQGGVSDACPLYLLPDMVSQRWVAPQPEVNPCPNCTFVPPPATSLHFGATPATPQGYVLAVVIDPEWQAPGISIDSVTLDVDRYSGDSFVERMTYAIPKDDLMNAANSTHLLGVKEVGNGDSLVGCTATLNFEVTVGGTTYSVQNPVYVDPQPD